MGNKGIKVAVVADEKRGYVYVLGNMFVDCLKIGATVREPHERARELSAATGVPEPYDVLFSNACSNPFEIERRVHELLGYCRVNESREFFDCTLHEAVEAIFSAERAG